MSLTREQVAVLIEIRNLLREILKELEGQR